jgi:exonuclease VII large subunit
MESVPSTKRARLLAGAALVAALGLAASACGGSSSSDTTTTAGASATVQWANGVCNSFGAWKASIQRAKASLGDNPSTSDLQEAGNQVEVATDALSSSLQALGKAPTTANAAAEQSIQTLRTQLQNDKKQIDNAVNAHYGSPAQLKAGAQTVKASVASASNSFTSTVDNLKSLDPKSELEKAFHQAAACEPFFA